MYFGGIEIVTDIKWVNYCKMYLPGIGISIDVELIVSL